MSTDTAACAQQIRDIGYCILRRHFPIDAIDACRLGFDTIARSHLEKHGETPNRGPNRHYISLPIQPPLYHPAFFDDEHILAIVSEILGDNILIDQFASDTPFKDSLHQEIHSDLRPIFQEDPDLPHPPALLAINWPFIDVTLEHGPFQIAGGTHKLPKTETIARIEAGEISLKSLPMEVGDVLIRDPRCLHRGSPNVTDTPRPVAVISFLRSWYTRERVDAHPISQSVWDTLSNREKQLMRRFVIDESQ